MATNFEVRLLLELWAFDGVPVGLGKLNKQCGGKAANNNAIRENLMVAGAVAVDPRSEGFRLTETGEALLAEALTSREFEFTSSLGKRTINILLNWVRSNPVLSAEPVAKAKGNTIESYEAFKVVALEIYDRLNRELKLDHLVPIYRIRREIGERASRSDFNSWLLKMQTEKTFRLQGGSVEDSSPDKIEDSITTEVSGIRCFAKRL
jgi:hypothetical protein